MPGTPCAIEMVSFSRGIIFNRIIVIHRFSVIHQAAAKWITDSSSEKTWLKIEVNFFCGTAVDILFSSPPPCGIKRQIELFYLPTETRFPIG